MKTLSNTALRIKVRNAVGKGTTESERGLTTLFFARGHKAYTMAFDNLAKAATVYVESPTQWTFKIRGRLVFLKKQVNGENNWVEFKYLGSEE